MKNLFIIFCDQTFKRFKTPAIGFLFAVIMFLFSELIIAQSNINDPSLFVGDDAPELKIEKWIKGGGFDHLEKGKIYVIDIWATWCVPCIAGMPHLSKLQQKYKEDGLEIIGITSEDSYGNTLAKVESFVRQRDSLIGYNVAWVPSSINADSVQGIFVHPWMQRIGSMKMPTAFIVDKNKKIAYIGDPHAMDQTLDDIIHERYELSSLKANYLDGLRTEKKLNKFVSAIQSNDIRLAILLGKEILDSSKHVQPITYLIMGSKVVSMTGKIDNRLFDIALVAAKRGVQMTQYESPGYLDVLASVYAAKGDYTQAVITEKLAISFSEGGMKDAQIQNLDKYLLKIKEGN